MTVMRRIDAQRSAMSATVVLFCVVLLCHDLQSSKLTAAAAAAPQEFDDGVQSTTRQLFADNASTYDVSK